jgi:hypothetical protein
MDNPDTHTTYTRHRTKTTSILFQLFLKLNLLNKIFQGQLQRPRFTTNSNKLIFDDLIRIKVLLIVYPMIYNASVYSVGALK